MGRLLQFLLAWRLVAGSWGLMVLLCLISGRGLPLLYRLAGQNFILKDRMPSCR